MPNSSRLRWWGLRLKILVWSFGPTALALVACGLVSYYAFQTTTRFLLIERSREVIRLVASQLSGQVENYTGILDSLGRIPGFASQLPTVQQNILNQENKSLVIFDGGVLVTNARGVITATEPSFPDLLGKDWSSRSIFREILRTREPVFSDIVGDGPGGAQVVVVAIPILSDRDEFLGMVAGMFRLGSTNASTFYGDIVRLRIGETENDPPMTVYLVDGSGRVIYHSQNREAIGEDYSVQQPVRHFLIGDFVDEFSNQKAGQPGYGGSTGVMRDRDETGRDVVAYYAAVPGTTWGLVAEAGWDGLMSFYRIYLGLQALLFALGIILPAIIVSYGIRRLTEPIYRLKAAAKQVATGHFGQEIHIKTGDELEELVDQFNHMSVQLSQSYQALREREERLALVLESTSDGIWDWDIRTGYTYYSPRWRAMLGYSEEEAASCIDTWFALMHPDDLEKAKVAVKTHFASGQRLYQMEHRLRHKDGTYRWIMSKGILLRDDAGQPVRMLGSHTDITVEKLAEEELFKAYSTLEERVTERTKYLAILNDFSGLVNRSLDITQTLSDTLDKTMEITTTEYGVAYRLEGDQEGRWLSPEEVAGLDPAHLYLRALVYRAVPERFRSLIDRVSLVDSGIESILYAEMPLILDVKATPISSRIQELLLEAGIEQVISIPIKVKGSMIGVIQLGARKVRSYSQDELNLLAAIGHQVGVSAENSRLHEAVQHTVALEERARLARDLHDSVTQSLYSVTLLAEAASRLLVAGDSQTAAGHLRKLRDAAQESLREMRLLIYELRPIALEKSGLAEAIRLRLDAVETRAGIKSEFTMEGIENLTHTVKLELYQITQETLNNILKHSHAANVKVRLCFDGARTSLEICDDGVGFDLQTTTSSGGLGLASIAERAHKIGGKLRVESAPGKGTRISVDISKNTQPVFLEK